MFLPQLVRQLESQGGDITGEDDPATPRRIFQILSQVLLSFRHSSKKEKHVLLH